MIDLHSHVLPNIDDGPKTSEESLECIQGLEHLGFTEIVPTPHRYHIFYNPQEEDVRKSVAELESPLIKRFSFEYTYNEGIIKKTENLHELYVFPKNRRVILVEFHPFRAGKKDIEKAVFSLNAMNVHPLLAHIERYGHSDEFWENLRQKYKVFLQIGLKSFSSSIFNSSRRQIMRLLEKGIVDNAATDIHNIKQLSNVEKALKTISEKFPDRKSRLFSFSCFEDTDPDYQ